MNIRPHSLLCGLIIATFGLLLGACSKNPKEHLLDNISENNTIVFYGNPSDFLGMLGASYDSSSGSLTFTGKFTESAKALGIIDEVTRIENFSVKGIDPSAMAIFSKADINLLRGDARSDGMVVLMPLSSRKDFEASLISHGFVKGVQNGYDVLVYRNDIPFLIDDDNIAWLIATREDDNLGEIVDKLKGDAERKPLDKWRVDYLTTHKGVRGLIDMTIPFADPRVNTLGVDMVCEPLKFTAEITFLNTSGESLEFNANLPLGQLDGTSFAKLGHGIQAGMAMAFKPNWLTKLGVKKNIATQLGYMMPGADAEKYADCLDNLTKITIGVGQLESAQAADVGPDTWLASALAFFTDKQYAGTALSFAHSVLTENLREEKEFYQVLNLPQKYFPVISPIKDGKFNYSVPIYKDLAFDIPFAVEDNMLTVKYNNKASKAEPFNPGTVAKGAFLYAELDLKQKSPLAKTMSLGWSTNCYLAAYHNKIVFQLTMAGTEGTLGGNFLYWLSHLYANAPNYYMNLLRQMENLEEM